MIFVHSYTEPYLKSHSCCIELVSNTAFLLSYIHPLFLLSAAYRIHWPTVMYFSSIIFCEHLLLLVHFFFFVSTRLVAFFGIETISVEKKEEWGWRWASQKTKNFVSHACFRASYSTACYAMNILIYCAQFFIV